MSKNNIATTPKGTQTTDSNHLFVPVVMDSKVLFMFCCLGIVSLDDSGEDFFNGAFLMEIREIFTKMKFGRIFIFKQPRMSAISIFFKYDSDQKKARPWDDDDLDDYFVITILKKDKKNYIEFSRDRGNVYHHDITTTSSTEGNLGERCITHPLTCDGIEAMKKDIEITLEHRHDWW